MKLFNRLFKWYFTKGALPYWYVLFLDCILVLFSGYVATYFEDGGMNFATGFWRDTYGLCIMLIPFIIFFKVFHTYTGIIRYSTTLDLQKVAMSTFAASICAYVLSLVFKLCNVEAIGMLQFYGICVMFCLSTFLMWIVRVAVKELYYALRKDSNTKRAVIYGVREGGIALAKSIKNQVPQKYTLAGFISPNGDLDTKYLFGVQVRKDGPNLIKHLQDNHIDVVAVSPLQTAAFRERTGLIDSLTAAGIKILMMPSAEEWDGKSDLDHQQLHEVEIEDLLPRDKIEVDLEAIGKLLKGKRILITGAAGSIGSEMVRQVAKFAPAELILVDQAETPMHDVRLYMARNYPGMIAPTIVGSIANPTQMEAIFREHRPEYVFHAAAYKHVPMMEDNPAMAIQNNTYGTRVIADLAVKYGTKKFVMISTDKAVNPTNVMGCSKRICEIYCQSLNKAIQDGTCPIKTLDDCASSALSTAESMDKGCQFITTRFGNVLGSNGSVIPIFKEQIKKGGPLTVTHPDIIRFFMLIPEACQLVLEAGTMGKGGEIFVFDMGKPVRIADLAKRMIDLSGAKNIEIKYTGLRDGEKLYEEVLADSEQSKPTVHPKIKVASVREYPYEEALKNEEELYKLSFTYDDMAIVKKMKEIVPEYKSRQSKYEALDK